MLKERVLKLQEVENWYRRRFCYDTKCKNGIGRDLWTMRRRDQWPGGWRSLCMLFNFSL